MVPSEIFARVFRVRCGAQEGACFTVDRNNRQYIVSAKHVLEEIDQVNSIELFHDHLWKTVSAKLVGHAEGNVDVSVCSINSILTRRDLDVEPSIGGLIYGQQVYFLGFPFGLYGDYPAMGNGYPFPFVKSAILSLLGTDPGPMFLDGINNKSSSGGPVVWRKLNEWNGPMRIAGIVSGYSTSAEPVFYNGSDLGHRYKANTGLIQAYKINYALDIIDQNPIGLMHPEA